MSGIAILILCSTVFAVVNPLFDSVLPQSSRTNSNCSRLECLAKRGPLIIVFFGALVAYFAMAKYENLESAKDEMYILYGVGFFAFMYRQAFTKQMEHETDARAFEDVDDAAAARSHRFQSGFCRWFRFGVVSFSLIIGALDI